MKVVALTRTTSLGPSTRYRIDQYRPLLRERGIDVELRPLFGPLWFRILERPAGPLRTLAKAGYSLLRLGARLAQVCSLHVKRPDLVLVEQQLFPYLPAWVETMLWPTRGPSALEFDDAIYLTPGHRKKLERLCACVELVIVGNRFLAEFARPHARRVAIIPTTVDLSRYADARALQRARRAEDDATFRVAWIGLRYNFPFLETLAGPLARLAADGIDVELRVISSGAPPGGPAWGDVRIIHRPWSVQTEAEELAACDASVMPLPDSEWARGKCGLKALQSMAAAVPVVCSPVGVNADIVTGESSGLLASDESAWHHALSQLATDRECRQRLGEAGLAVVETAYDLRGGAEKVAEAYGLAALRADEGSESLPESAADPRRR